MNYDKWINREKKIRIKILKSSPIIQKKNIYRVCKECEEICLCHENSCPNCSSFNIKEQIIEDDYLVFNKIRCQHRFKNLIKEEKDL